MSFALYETTPNQPPRSVVVGHVQRHMLGCEPRVRHPDDPATLDEATFVAELEAEASLQERGPAPPQVRSGLAGVVVIDDDGEPEVCDFTGWPADRPLPLELADQGDEPNDQDTTPLAPPEVIYGPPRGH
jgi:hypothetical protein